MNKIWYILIDEQKEGPFSLFQLKSDTRVTPDTLVWREGFPDWVPARQVQEFASLFEDDELKEQEEEIEAEKPPTTDELALSFSQDPMPLLFWLLFAALVLSYVLFRLFI